VRMHAGIGGREAAVMIAAIVPPAMIATADAMIELPAGPNAPILPDREAGAAE